MSEKKTYESTKLKDQKGCLCLSRSIYTLIIVGLWSMMIYKIYLCFQKFYSGNTYEEVKAAGQETTSFPDLTICSAMAGGLREGILEVKSQRKNSTHCH